MVADTYPVHIQENSAGPVAPGVPRALLEQPACP